jgi:hypothetical protein
MTVANGSIEEFLARGNQITETVGAAARICAQFLPKYELPLNTKSVILTNINKFTLAVDDVTTVPLTEIRVRFVLDWQQLSTTDLTTPLYIVRKNAQAYCRLEDRLMLLCWGWWVPKLNEAGLTAGCSVRIKFMLAATTSTRGLPLVFFDWRMTQWLGLGRS